MEKNYAVGIDIGGTNTNIAVVDRRGEILSRKTISTHCGGNDINEYIKILSQVVMEITAPYRKDNVAGSQTDSVVGIGVGAPCANYTTGSIEAATDLPWPSPIPLSELLEAATGYNVKVTNDANAAAAGEMNYGAARGMNDFIMLTLGTGVGSGVVCNGILLTGNRGFAGELGHCRVVGKSDRLCGCGRKGCLQTYASAKGVVNTAVELLSQSNEPSCLRNIPENELSAKIIYDAAKKDDSIAKRVFEITGTALGEACSDFASFTDPEAIILFGGVAKSSEFLVGPMRDALEKNVLHLYRNRIKILESCLPEDDAALLGASALVWGK